MYEKSKATSRSQSPFFAPLPPKHQLITTPNGSITQVKDIDEVAKSSVIGAAFNLSNNIVGAGIVGIPFALSQCSLILGTILIAFFGLMTVKSLRLLIETAKHVDVPSYERLAEASFGRSGFAFISVAMFIMSFGGMVSYLMIIKANLSNILGVGEDDIGMRNAVLTLSSLMILLPISLQRDMGNLAKTSIISVIFVCLLVGIIVVFSPNETTIQVRGGINQLLSEEKTNFDTLFTGIGVLCFAFVCQHSSFIIASSLERPTRKRWNQVTGLSITVCSMLAIIMGVGGYLGYMADTDGDILVNLGKYASAADVTTQHAATIARFMLCTIMFLVYPMELFVARHVCVVLLFKGRRAHEGDDHAVLARKDRRVSVTTMLYLISLLPALIWDDVGSAFAISGALGGAALSYMGPGVMYIAVHGSEFLDMASKKWSYHVEKYRETGENSASNTTQNSGFESNHRRSKRSIGERGIGLSSQKKSLIGQFCDCLSWHICLMPLWCKIAARGERMIKTHLQQEASKSPFPYPFGKIIHNNMHHRTLMRPQNSFTQSPANNNAYDDSSEEEKPLVRVGSLPTVIKSGTRIGSLGSLKNYSFNSSSKKKVLFAEQDSLGKSTSFKETDYLLSDQEQISAQSFYAPSFEVIRPGTAESLNIENEAILNSSKHSSMNSYPIFEEEESFPVGLNIGHESYNYNNDFYDNERDLENEFPTPSTVVSSTTSEMRDVKQRIEDEEVHESYDTDIDEARSHTSSIFVEKEVDEEMYESDCASDASSVKVAPSPIPTRTFISAYSKYDNIKANPRILHQMNQKGEFVEVVKASPNSTKVDVENDPQDATPSLLDFMIAMFYVLFGLVAVFAGLFSVISPN
mmetsp:Transcript_22225/g.27265  ORF Transcript_22225/g.27265 Transcript_22225/m.27265 type:complete len:863 (+) Transcript_22225:179-2767(+)